MGEEKKSFKKSRFLTMQEVKDKVNDYMTIKLNDLDTDTAFTAKIMRPAEIEEYEQGGKPKKSGKLVVEYSSKELPEPVELTVQAGISAVERLMEKHPDNSYVGKYAIFSRTFYEGTKPQFINVLENEPREMKDKNELFKKKDSTSAANPELNNTEFNKFREVYIKAMIEKKRELNYLHMIGSYIATHEKEAYAELIAKCEEAVKHG